MGKKKKSEIFTSVLGKKIRIFRKLKGLTQIELGKELGYTSTGAISLIETGKRGMVMEKIYKAAQVFGVNPEDLISEKNYTPHQAKLLMFFYDFLHNKIETSPHSKTIETLLDLTYKE